MLRLKKILKLERIVFGLVFLLLSLTLFIPLMNPWTIFPATFGKGIILQIMIEAGLFFYFLLLLIKYRRGFLELNIKFIKNPLTISILLFFALLAISTITSVNIPRSFWGDPERYEGLFTLIHYLVFFFLIYAIVFRTEKRSIFFLALSVFVSLIIGVLGMREFLTNHWRVQATLGNPDLLATYILFHVFLVLFLVFYSKRLFYRLLFIAIFIFEIAVLAVAGSRGAFLGFLSGLFVSLLLVCIATKKRVFILIMVFLIISTGGLFYLSQVPNFFVSRSALIRRLTAISLQAGKSRLEAWRIGLSAWRDRPIAGWGLENFTIAFDDQLRARYFKTYPNIKFDRAHNRTIDMLVMNGIFTTLAYLLIFIIALYLLYKKSKLFSLSLLPIGGGLAAYFVANLFIFDHPSSYLIFFIYLALIIALPFGGKTNKQSKQIDLKRKYALLFVPAMVLIAAVNYLYNFRPWQAGVFVNSALSLQETNPEQSALIFKRTLEQDTFLEPYISQFYGQFLIAKLKGFNLDNTLKSQYIADLSQVSSELHQLLLQERYDSRFYLNLGNMENVLAVKFDPVYFAKSEEIFQRAIEFYPNIFELYIGLVIAQIYQSKWEQSRITSEKLLKFNDDKGLYYFYLALSEIGLGNLAAGEEQLNQAMKLGYNYHGKKDLLLLVRAYLSKEKYQEVADLYEGLIIMEPDNINFYGSLAKVYQAMGDYSSARAIAQKMLEIDPRLKSEVEVFLMTLEQ